MISGALTDTLSARIALIDNEQEGFIENNLDGTDGPKSQNQGVRASLAWAPSDELVVNLKLEQGNFDNYGTSTQLTEAGPHLGFLSLFDPNIETQYDRHNSYDTTYGKQLISTNTNNITLDMEYELGEHTLTSITAFSGYDSYDSLAADFSPMPLLHQWQTQDFEQLSQELLLTSPGGETVDYQVGFYYQDGELDYTTDTLINLSLLNPAVPGAGIFHNVYGQTSESWAIFAETTWNITDDFSVTGGLRYTEETKDVGMSNVVQEADRTPAGPVTQYIYQAFAVNYELSDDRSESNVTPLIKVQYNISADMMGYVSASKGFKGGGYNMNTGNPGTQPMSMNPRKPLPLKSGSKPLCSTIGRTLI